MRPGVSECRGASGLGRAEPCIEQKAVEALNEVVALLVVTVNVVLFFHDGQGGGLRVAGAVFRVPEVKVGAVQAERNGIGRAVVRQRRLSGMPLRGSGVLRASKKSG
jgi:hypothetical protein